MKCRFLLYFITLLLGFHFVDLYPNIKLNKDVIDSPNIDKLKQDQAKNDTSNIQDNRNEEKEISPDVNETTENEQADVATYQSNNQQHTSNLTGDKFKAYQTKQKPESYVNDPDLDVSGDSQNQRYQNDYIALPVHQKPYVNYDIRYERQPNYRSNPSGHLHQKIDKQQEYNYEYDYQDSYNNQPIYDYANRYFNNVYDYPYVSRQSPESYYVNNYLRRPQSVLYNSARDPYYRNYVEQYYNHKYPNYRYKEDKGNRFKYERRSYIPKNWELNSDESISSEYSKENTEPDPINTKTVSSYIEKYFRPEYIMPIPTTNKLHEDKAEPKVTPEDLKWVENFEEDVSDNLSKSETQENSSLSKDQTLVSSTEEKNETIELKTSTEDKGDDIPHMKPISEPLTWFRPDDKFWNKVQNGETKYDKVVFLQVRPTALIERNTHVLQYENGTVVKDYHEVFWEHEDDKSPKEITSKRVIEHPDGSSITL